MRSALVLFLLVLIFVLIVLLVLVFLLVLIVILFVLLIVLILHNEYSFLFWGYVLIMPRINRFYANLCHLIATQDGQAKRIETMRTIWWMQLQLVS